MKRLLNRTVRYDSQQTETEEQYAKRWKSIRIIYLTMFFDSLSFSVVLSSLWPYLQKVNGGGEVNPTLVGWANVSFHVTGILVDFLMGFWTTKRGSIEPLLLSLLFFGVGNFMYGYAQACGPHGVTVIIVSRGVIGLSTGVNVVARAALADSTTLKERTSAMAHMSVLQGIGFAFGPAVQLLSIPLGDDGLNIPFMKLQLNLYTAPAFVSVLVAVLNCVLILVCYHEYHVNIYLDQHNNNDVADFTHIVNDTTGKKYDMSYDRVAVISLLFLYFAAQKAFALFETILPPLTMDMLAWTRQETALYASLLFLSAGIVAIMAFAATDLAEKVCNDKLVLLIGFLLIFMGFFIHLPWDNRAGVKIANATRGNGTGCPSDYAWCYTTPRLHISQIITGTVFLSVGYPFIMVFTSSLYSKVLGPSPQGIMQSWFGATGGLARICAPVIITYLYVDFGPKWTFIVVDCFLLFAVLVFMSTHKRLIPYHKFVLNKNIGLKEQGKFPKDDPGKIPKDTEDEDEEEEGDEEDRFDASQVILRTSLNLDQYCSRPNRWSLIDRRSFYLEGVSYEIQHCSHMPRQENQRIIQ